MRQTPPSVPPGTAALDRSGTSRFLAPAPLPLASPLAACSVSRGATTWFSLFLTVLRPIAIAIAVAALATSAAKADILADTITGYSTEGMPGLPNSLGDTTGVFAAIPIRVLPDQNTVLSDITLIGFGGGPSSNKTGSPDFSEFKLSIGVYSSLAAFEANYYHGDRYHANIPNGPGYFTYSAYGIGMESPYGGSFTTYKLDFNLRNLNINLPADEDSYVVLYLNAHAASSGDFNSSITSRQDLPTSICYYGGPGPIQGYPGTEFWPGTSGVAAYKIEGRPAGPDPAAFDIRITSTGPLSAMPVSGFYRQEVTVRNESTAATGFKLEVTGLPPGATLYNGSGRSSGGLPFVRVDQPLAAGAELILTLQYYIPVLPAGGLPAFSFTLTDSDLTPPDPSAPFDFTKVKTTPGASCWNSPPRSGRATRCNTVPTCKAGRTASFP